MRMTFSEPSRYAAPAPLGCAGGCGGRSSRLGETQPMPEGSAAKLVLGLGAIIGMMGIAVLIANKAEGR